MNFDYAVAAADVAARALFRPPEEAPPWWTDVADRPLSQADLARFVERNPGAPAEGLYRFVAGRNASPAAWRRLAPQMRSAFEIFRASFSAMLVLVREAERARDQPRRPRERPKPIEPATAVGAAGADAGGAGIAPQGPAVPTASTPPAEG
ncbi:MAG: hypothetical protein WCZ28_06060 [Burkholderiaceae bacterium]